jgi:hypothetical protein
MAMKLTNPDEIEIAGEMLRWERVMPAPGKRKQLGTFENSQMMRLELVLIEVGKRRGGEAFYKALSSMTTGERGKRYIAKGFEDMGWPLPLTDGWHLEGTMSLEQKRDLLHHLTKFSLSARFLACAADFVAGNSVRTYLDPGVNGSR